MASTSDIAEVRLSTDEPTETPYDDTFVGSLIDTYGVAGACSRIWDSKAAAAAKLVNVSEAGASHAMSDRFKNFSAMAKEWAGKETEASSGRIRVKTSSRSDS